MTDSAIPPEFFGLFGAAFVTNLTYVATCFLLERRLNTPAVERRGIGPFSAFNGSLPGLIGFLRFVFSNAHLGLDDEAVTRLTWAVRILLLLGLTLTLTVFVQFAGIV
ncbi:hypothetical protein [Brevundimonas lutea]|uniref:hypothetical protein n=1 Tax=Brevundimonas lutea TaxID=2293980 RepID=UPI000F03F854|nr:hypothetical protein [Brevundimonas lutea]